VTHIDGLGEIEEVTDRILAVLDTGNRIPRAANPEGSQ
jgi:hypothetical protein